MPNYPIQTNHLGPRTFEVRARATATGGWCCTQLGREEQVLKVIAIVAASTITNYAGTIVDPPLEGPFRQYVWQS
jgi:hypothetical protein